MDSLLAARMLLIEIRLVVYPNVTSVPFNDAYRHMDWLAVRLLLIEVLLVVYPKVTSVPFSDACRCRDWLPTMRLLLTDREEGPTAEAVVPPAEETPFVEQRR